MEWSSIGQRPSDSPHAHRQRAHGCQAVGCSAAMATGKLYFQRKHLCRTHMQAESVQIAGTDQLYRYCFQCGKLESIECFDGNKRTCRVRLQKRREQPSNHKKRTGSGSSGSRCKRASCSREPCCNTPIFPAAPIPGAQGWMRYAASTWPCAANAGAWEFPAAAQASTAVSTGLRAPAQLVPAGSSVEQQLLGGLQMLPRFTSASQAAGFTCAPQAQKPGRLLDAQQVSSFAAAAPSPFAPKGATQAQGAIPQPAQSSALSPAQGVMTAPGPSCAAAQHAPFARTAAALAPAPVLGTNIAAGEPGPFAHEGAPVSAPVPGPNTAAADLASLLAELLQRSQELQRDPEEGLEHMLESELAAAALGTAIVKQAVQSPGARSVCFSERLAEALVADSCLFDELEAVTSPRTGQHTQAHCAWQACAPGLAGCKLQGEQAQAQMTLQGQIPAQASEQLQAGLQPGVLYSQQSFTGSSLPNALSGQSLVRSSSDGVTALLGCNNAAGMRAMPVVRSPVAVPSVGYGAAVNQQQVLNMQQPSGTASMAAVLFAPLVSGDAAATAGTAGSFLAPSASMQGTPWSGCCAQPGMQIAAPCTVLEPACVPAAAAAGFLDQQVDRLQAMQVQVTQLQNTVQCLKQQLGM